MSARPNPKPDTHTKAKAHAPIPIYDYLKSIADSGLPRAQRDLLRALMTWLSAETWELFPSVGSIAKAMAVDRRTVQRVLNELCEAGIVARVRGHRSGTNVLRVNYDELRNLAIANREENGGRHDDTPSGGNIDAECVTSTQTVRRDATQTNHSTSHESTTSTRVVERVETLLANRADLLDHPHATPERLAYIARNAHRKRNPTGWAIKAIEEGFDVQGTLSPDRRRTLVYADRLQRLRNQRELQDGSV